MISKKLNRKINREINRDINKTKNRKPIGKRRKTSSNYKLIELSTIICLFSLWGKYGC